MKHDCFVKERREEWFFHLECLTNRETESSPHREANLIRQKGQSTLGGTIQLLQKMEDFSDMGCFSESPL